MITVRTLMWMAWWVRWRLRLAGLARTRPLAGCLPSPTTAVDVSPLDPGDLSSQVLADVSVPRDLRARCPVCADKLAHLDVLFAVIEQAAKGRIAAAVELGPVLAGAYALIGHPLDEVADMSLAVGGMPPGWFAWLDRTKAGIAEAIVTACPCWAGG